MNGRSAVRLERLREAIRRNGTLPLAEAAALCDVSEMTVRRDIAASNGAIVSFGGHLVMADNPQFAAAYNLDAQRDQYAKAKQRLCEAVASRIEDGDTVFVDCGTTLMPFCTLLPREMNVTIVTYALNVANAFSQRDMPNMRLVVLGGLYYASSDSFGGQDVTTAIRRLGINKALISAAGVHAEKGASCFHFHEVAPKQAAIEHAERRILVADESKLDVMRAAFFADLADFDTLLTSGDPGRAWRDRMKESDAAKVEVV
ncbi:DeoR/GlpR family DNA-binding transcription regulator [Salinicola sp. LHM]|uniref:DeoR/GlpR family DNA-binding transcription regulator n=1 Tax=Salinicola sp. LHM TaxID=3065298 RepID=UPI002ACE4D6E|nr:DeoR/GlpR family DNA-binding transcription regulator [Salinicola sp. LHM]WQH34114.1 DeoR/GlpR family DNA-binding transcription regulator [Salinicola sp. LHM]